MSTVPEWESRYADDEYLFGTEPCAFLLRHRAWLPAGARVLAVADGEGRNGVWLAQQGLAVHAVDGSANALAKAARLAASRDVSVHFEQADLTTWMWPAAAYDVVLGVFIQFGAPSEQQRIVAGMRQATRPGGLVMLHGYTPAQLQYRTGGPSDPAQLWTRAMLDEWFADWACLHGEEYEAYLHEGSRHRGQSALIDYIARRPAP